MLAIPVFRARVAPVLDWCTKMMVFPDDGPDAASGRQIDAGNENIFGLIRTLREQGIQTLVCGALSPEILNYGESIGLRIIHGIAGEIEEVLRAYREQKLDQPRYWLPGCGGQRRYKGGARCTAGGRDKTTDGGGPGGSGTTHARKSSGRLPMSDAAGGPGGFCMCPECGWKKEHERGIPCSQVECPACHNPMTRDKSP